MSGCLCLIPGTAVTLVRVCAGWSVGNFDRKQVFVGHHCTWRKAGGTGWRLKVSSAPVCLPDDDKENTQVAD